MRVLIADDQRSFGIALADMVRWCGHDVVAVVGSGLEAIHAYTLHKPNLVLMDHRMPKLNGATACRHILAKDPSARVILVSAWSPLDGTDESGALSFLPKPIDLERLKAALGSVAKIVPPPDLPSSIFDLPVLEMTFALDAPQIQFEQVSAVEAAAPATPKPGKGSPAAQVQVFGPTSLDQAPESGAVLVLAGNAGPVQTSPATRKNSRTNHRRRREKRIRVRERDDATSRLIRTVA